MKIRLIDGKYREINIVSQEAADHFSDPKNYTGAILDQFVDSIYADYITKKDKIFLDIGGNIGLFALHVLPQAEKLICVEPTPEHMRLQKEILAGLDVIHEEAALSENTGTAQFYWCGINTTMNSLQNRGDRSFTVQTITLADLCAKHDLKRVDFCKVDIEGSEWGAITVKTLMPVKDIIRKFFIELHPPNQESQAEFEKIFQAAGYKTERVIHDTLFCHK